VEQAIASDAGSRPLLPRIAVTVGDPAGIGPEIAARAAADPRVVAACHPVLYGPSSRQELAPFVPGRPTADTGRVAYDAVFRAVADARAGIVEAIATGPISKEAFALAGLPWKGHTDLLASLCEAPQVAMLFHSPPLRVVLATVHMALSEVPRALTGELVTAVVELAARELPRFGYPAPRLGMAALNPHAGEHGLMGVEDDEVIRPAIDRCRARGIDIEGPIPADTVFVRAVRGEFDAVVACYHDQGLIPVKVLAFGRSVNVTLGLPIVRTSVDHGTAFDIAGRGLADHASLVEAVLLAARLARG
jgi:4-phospho-D-threonate 3-dehydrogenase / 4-phospho-D-erythronate 3-dehydrogenase